MRELGDAKVGEAADPCSRRRCAKRSTGTLDIGPHNIFVGLAADFEDRVPAGRIDTLIAEAEAEAELRALAVDPRHLYQAPGKGISGRKP